MKCKKVILTAIAIILCFAIVAGTYRIYKFNKVCNVFDEIYLSAIADSMWHPTIEYPIFLKTSFRYVEDLGRIQKGIFSMPDNLIFGEYGLETLGIGRTLIFDADPDKQMLTFSAKCYLENYIEGLEDSIALRYIFRYDFDEKILQIAEFSLIRDNPNEQIEFFDSLQIDEFMHEYNITCVFFEQHRDYFLYDRLLTDWVTGNYGKSKFTVEDYGNFTIIDNTFEDLE